MNPPAVPRAAAPRPHHRPPNNLPIRLTSHSAAGRLCGRFGHAPAPGRPRSPTRTTPRPFLPRRHADPRPWVAVPRRRTQPHRIISPCGCGSSPGGDDRHSPRRTRMPTMRSCPPRPHGRRNGPCARRRRRRAVAPVPIRDGGAPTPEHRADAGRRVGAGRRADGRGAVGSSWSRPGSSRAPSCSSWSSSPSSVSRRTSGSTAAGTPGR